MSKDKLLSEQYADASNLEIRGKFNKKFSDSRHPHLWVFEKLESEIVGNRILEVGCGTGSLWDLNSEKIPEDSDFVLTDFSCGMLEEARSNISKTGFKYCVADAEKIPFTDESFDVVVANQMLYHVERENAVPEIKRVLKKGGKLYASTVNSGNKAKLYEMMDEASESEIESPSSDSGFALENGWEELEEYFETVEKLVFERSLEVTETKPLVAYALSTTGFEGFEGFTEEDAAELARMTEKRLEKQEFIEMQNDYGVFIAEK